MSDRAGDILLIGGFLAIAWAWLRTRMGARGSVEIGMPIIHGPMPGISGGGATGGAPDLSDGFSISAPDWPTDYFGGSFMPTATPPATQAAPVKQPDVLSLADARSLAKSIVNKHFSGRVDPAMVVAMIEIESGFRRTAYRYERHLDDASYGLMQVLYKTAKWLHDDLKYRGYSLPAGEAMYDAATGIYFGCAYIDWLRKHPRATGSEEWVVMSYNGGPGADNSMTRNHLAKYNAAKARQAQVK
ncbi:MAG: transglycosylase SLT domain-containing protein [Parvibaculum sp.]